MLIIATSGGLSTLAADIADEAGLELPDFDEDIKKRLSKILLPQIKAKKPLDIGQIQSDPYMCTASPDILEEYDSLLLIFGDAVEDASKIIPGCRANTDIPIAMLFSGGDRPRSKNGKKFINSMYPFILL